MQIENSFGCIPIKKDSEGYQVFLVKLSSGNHWGFPKGHKENIETPIQTAKRELFEETSLTIESVLPFSPIIEKYILLRDGIKTKKTVEYFIVNVSGEVHLQYPEIIDGRWVFISEAENLLTYDESKKTLQILIQYLQ